MGCPVAAAMAAAQGKLQDADLLALDTLRTRAGQVGSFAGPIFGTLERDRKQRPEEVGPHFLGARF